MINRNKKAQEEMVGFALIIIMVAVILLVFLTISMKKSNNIEESYEIDSFLQAMLEYTTSCSLSTNSNYISVDRLISECSELSTCKNGLSSCEILNETLSEMLPIAWPVEETSQFKAYEFLIFSGIKPEPMINLTSGQLTNTSRGASQYPTKNTSIFLTVYY